MKHGWNRFILVGLLIPLMSSAGYAQDINDVARRLQKQMRDMEARHKAEMDALKDQVDALRRAQPPDTSEISERLADLEEEMDQVSDLTLDFDAGTTNFIVTGYTFANFFDLQDEDSSFSAGFNPIFVWKLSDQLFIKSELEVELEESETEVALEYLDLSYVVNDYLTLSAGKFLTPLSYFKENLHPAWINKLPKQPLFASGGKRLIPTSSLGVQARGAIPFGGGTRLTYAAYVSNGFTVNTTGDKTGKLAFKNFEDINNNKAFGGRVGFFFIPELEGYYAFNFSDVAPTGSMLGSVDALVQVAGLNFVTDHEAIGGLLDIRFEYVFSDVDDIDFGGGAFDNEREGGYAQIAYRPTGAGSFFEKFEGVFRYDFIDQPSGAPDAADIDRFTFGVNYWVSPSAVVKIAYQFDDVDDPAGGTGEEDGLLLQFAIGF